jgi:N utilization substance protein B
MAMQLPRRKQREILLQLLFSWEVSKGLPVEDPVDLMMESLEVSKKNVLGMIEKLDEIIKHVEEIDKKLTRASLDYSLERISLTDKNILRIAIFEMMFEKEQPKIVIEEAIRLSKKFSSPEAVSYVHAIIDEVNQSENGSLSV